MDNQASTQLPRRLSLRLLQAFKAVTYLGSSARAAEPLFFTQLAVSMQIKRLEDGLGITLVEQIGKQIYLTDTGKLVREHT